MTHIFFRNCAGGLALSMVVNDGHLGETDLPSLQMLTTIALHCCLHHLYVACSFVWCDVNNLPLVIEVAESAPV